MTDKPTFNLVSFSGGKDSTAMLLGMVERKIPINCVLFCDTGIEFPQMYEHISKVENAVGMPITHVKSEQSFEHLLLECPIERKENSLSVKQGGNSSNGYSWAGPKMRWCTSRLKDVPREKYLKPLREKYNIIEYVGIAADEQFRLERKRNKSANHVHPLIEWGMTEADCLNYCYEKGYDWGGLYEHFHRVSCWCCPLQSLDELRQLYRHFPDLWAKLKDWDNRTWRNFRADFNVEQLEIRFNLEDEYLANGLSIRKKAFFDELRRLIDKH